MRTIPDTYESNGYAFALVERKGLFAIYSQTRNGASRPIAFEVHRIRTRRKAETTSFGVKPAGEYLASNKDWGKYGWTFLTIADARMHIANKTRELEEAHKS